VKQALLDYWQARNPRERLILMAVGGLVLLGLLYAYLWQPIADERDHLRKNLPQLQSASAQMQASADEAERLKTKVNATAGVNVMNSIETSATARNLRDKLSSVSAVDANHVRVVSGSIAFDDWLAWSKELQAQGIRIESAQVNTLQEGSGLVKLLATFAGPGK
jgi:general secretion pathway protein M